jgi:hypothetical protein
MVASETFSSFPGTWPWPLGCFIDEVLGAVTPSHLSNT